MIKFQIDKSINKKLVEENKLKLKNKSDREFVFYNDQDLRNFILIIRSRVYNLNNKNLSINMI